MSSAEGDDETTTHRRPPLEERWAPGTRVGRYQLLKQLGRGGAGLVFLALREGANPSGFEKLVCIKVLRSDVTRSEHGPEFYLRLMDEAKLAANIRSDNIVDVYDVEQLDGDYVIVMRYEDGLTLSELVASYNGGPIPATQAVYIIARILRGARRMHEAVNPRGEPLDLVHRDMKFSNVLLAREGGIKISDFGLAIGVGRQYETREDDTLIRGTARFMAPEQVRLDRQLDGRTDVYAIGVMLFQMLTGGKHPARHHEAADFRHAYVLTLQETRVPLKEYAPWVPAKLCEVVDRMVAHDRSRRPTADEAMVALLAAVRIDFAAEEEALTNRINDILGGKPVNTMHVSRTVDEVTDRGFGTAAAESGVQARASTAQVPVVQAPAHKPVATRRSPRLALTALMMLGAVATATYFGTRDSDPLVPAREKPVVESSPAPSAKKVLPTTAAAAARTEPLAGQPNEPAGPIAQDAPPSPSTGSVVAAAAEPLTSESKPTAPRAAAPSKSAEVADKTDGEVKNAWLDVAVKPSDRTWQVWVDDQYCGTADVKVKVTPGKHKVEVGAERPTVTRSVRVAPRGTRQVTFEL